MSGISSEWEREYDPVLDHICRLAGMSQKVSDLSDHQLAGKLYELMIQLELDDWPAFILAEAAERLGQDEDS